MNWATDGLAVVLGAHQFPNAPVLDTQPAFARSAAEVRQYLEREGLRSDRLKWLFDDEAAASDQTSALAAWLRDHRAQRPTATLLVYYVGHGQVLGDDYVLACRKSAVDQRNSFYSSRELADLLTRTVPGWNKLLVLDCCFAGNALRHFLTVPRCAVLCAAGAGDTTRVLANGEMTRFTDALLHVLRSGARGRGPRLSLRDLYQEVLATCERHEWERPTLQTLDPAAKVEEVAMFGNRAWVEAAPSNLATSHGAFRQPGSVHLHIDGGKDMSLIEDLHRQLVQRQVPTKVTHINDFVAGPQRESENRSMVQTYQAHTPGDGRDEELEYFTTSLLSSRDRVQWLIEELLCRLNANPNVVVELEQVVAVLDGHGRWSGPVGPSWAPDPDSVRFKRPASVLAFETHFCVNIQRAGTAPPRVTLKRMGELASDIGLRVGGWFMFDRADAWSYRSNAFSPSQPRQDVLAQQRQTLLAALERELQGDAGAGAADGIEAYVVVEKTLAVWKTPVEKTNGDFVTVPELAQWESELSSTGSGKRNFWVVTPNFLGDKRDDVRKAMARNLRNGTFYTYFLRTFADFKRWTRFATELREELETSAFEDKQLQAILLRQNDAVESGENWPSGEWFVKLPGTPQQEGFRLQRKDGEVVFAKPMAAAEVNRLVKDLAPLVTEASQRRWTWVPVRRRSSSREFSAYLVFADLDIDGEALDDAAVEQIASAYDMMLAEEVSKHGGSVHKTHMSGRLLIFQGEEKSERRGERLRHVLECIFSLIEAGERASAAPSTACPPFPRQRILLDRDERIRRIVRAYGEDVGGQAIVRGTRCLRDLEFGRVHVSGTVKAEIERWSRPDELTFEAGALQNYWICGRSPTGS